MDDPWAAGPSWTSNKSSKNDTPSIDRQTTFTPPPGEFDVSDPWGISGAKVPAKLPGEDSVKRIEESNRTEEDDGWGAGGSGGGWGGSEQEQRNVSAEEDRGVVNLNDSAEDHDDELEMRGGWSTGPEVPQRPLSPDERHEDETPSSIDLTAVSSSSSSPQASPPPQLAASASESSNDYALRGFGLPSPPTAIPDLSDSPPRFSIPPDLPSFAPPSPENAFSNALPTSDMPKSPGFGEDAFGGFSNGDTGSDPWGANMGPGGGWGDAGDNAGFSGGFTSRAADMNEQDDSEDEEDGWGGARRSAHAPREELKQDEDWEEAQRRMRLQEDRAPREKIEKIKDEWKAVVLGLVIEKLEAMSEEEEDKLKAGVRELEAETYEKTRSLAMIPPDINTYPPVISSLVTHERHTYALSRPNPAPSTSLISTTLARKPKRNQALDQQSPWLTRSKLGEPEAPVPESAPIAPDASGSKWSFWRKNTQERPLVTSGGGVLEVKSPVTPTLSRASSEIKAASKPPSIMSRTSRPSSPAPPIPVSSSIDDFGYAASSGIIDSTSASSIAPTQSPVNTAASSAPAPSAVSRFFGRLGRSKAPIQQADHDDNTDLEISADEFNFLSEIPSYAQQEEEKGMGDLLSMQAGRGEQMAGLESMLASKPAALPAALAPPPRGPSRTASSSSFKIAPPARSSDMDLLGGLYFGDSPTSTPPPVQKSPPSSNNTATSSMWDDFLASTPAKASPSAIPKIASLASPIAAPSPRPAPASIAGPSSATSPPSRQSMSALTPTQSGPTPPPKHAPRNTFASTSSFGDFGDFDDPSQPIAPRTVHALSADVPRPAGSSSTLAPPASNFDDFDDFGTPQNASTATFDTFDFSSFDTPAPKKSTAVQPGSFGKSHPTRGSLDHTPTISLLAGASASKGKQWPAPPSPIGFPLAPPPRADDTPTAGFPFLSPPPPSSRSPAGGTRNNSGMDLLGMSEQAVMNNASVAPTPPRVAVPMVPQSSAMSKSSAAGSQGGLSATDLSFFDSL